MAKKTKHKKKKKKVIFSRFTNIQRQILAIILIIIAIVLFLGLFDIAGVAGEFLALILQIIFAWASWFVPVVLIVAALLVLGYNKAKEQEVKVSYKSRFLSLVFILIVLSGIFHISYINDELALQAHRGGGYVGFGLSYIIVNTFGVLATWIIFIGFLIILLIITFNGLLKVKSESVSNGIKSMFRKKQIIPKPEQRDEIVKIDNEDEEEISTSKIKKSSIFFKKPKLPQIDVSYAKINKKIDMPFELLQGDSSKPNAGDVKANKLIIQKTLENFGIPVEMGETKTGPTVTQYTLKPADGIKLSQITTLNNDLAMSLAAHPIRIEAPIPGRSMVGIEVPNQKIAIIRLKEILSSDIFKKRKSNLTLCLGRDVAGHVWLSNIDKMPHLLVAGATGSGKTIFLNSIIISLIYQNSPDDLRFILVDPKRVELTFYNKLPHLLTPVITDVNKTINALKWAISEMDRRFEIMHNATKRNIVEYNQDAKEKLPYIVIIIDELADLMVTATQEVETCIIRLAQMARATGIHLVMATQRPSVDVITGLIKANITSRVAFSVASVVDSRTILDFAGAEKLLGRGDMLFVSPELSKPKRIQAAYVSDREIKNVVEYLNNITTPDYEEGVTESQGPGVPQGGFGELKQDELLPEAKEVIIQAKKASASLLQRRLRIGYARAARLLDLLEEEGCIGPVDGAKPREVYITKDEEDIIEKE